MPGAIDLSDESTKGVPHYRVMKSKSQYAKRNSAGQWVAGPKAKGYDEGEYIPTKTVEEGGKTMERPAGIVGQQWSQRRRSNMVKSVMRASGVGEAEAREKTKDLLDELSEAETDQERKEVWKKYAS